MSFFLIKRDVTTVNYPSPDQIDVGELVVNAVTGILYTKLTDGTVVKFMSSPITTSNVPVISFDIPSNFCCDNDTITIRVSNLVVGGIYTYQLTDLSNNINFIPLDQATGSLEPSNATERYVSILASRTGDKNVSLIKFTVSLNGSVVSENVASINCGTCLDSTQNI